MTRTNLLSIACTYALVMSSCNVERPGNPSATPSASASDVATTTPAPASQTSPTAPVAATTPDATPDAMADARFDGYGDMRFGMTAAEAAKAWAGELTRLGTEGESCYYLTPKWVKNAGEFAFMVEDDRFVRYSTQSAKLTAPGGGKVGMSTPQIEALYAGRIERMPHKYTDGQDLRIKDSADATRAVLFETDAKGMVTNWRAGVAPQVDYVEGCA